MRRRAGSILDSSRAALPSADFSATPTPRHADTPTLRHRRSAFTLIEVLATLLLLAIVIPVAMMATTQSLKMADTAKHRATAASLAEGMLAKIVASGEWQQGSLSGDFGPDYPEYTWAAESASWTDGLVQELVVVVYWGTAEETASRVTVSTLVYQTGGADSAAAGTGGTAP